MEQDQIVRLRKLTQQHAYTSLQMHESAARKAGFAGTDHKYLGLFLQKGTMTAGEPAALTGLTTGAVTGLTDSFGKKNLVKRSPDKYDRRKVLIVPNPKKIKALLEPLYRKFQAETDKLIAGFSDEELAAIETYLSKSISLMTTTQNDSKDV